MPGAVPVALLLVVATLQLQTACGRSPWTEADQPARVQAMPADSLIQAVEQYFKVCSLVIAGVTPTLCVSHST